MKVQSLLPRCMVWAVVLLAVAAGSSYAQAPFRLTPAARFFTGMQLGYFFMSGDMLVPAGGRPGSGTRVDLSNLGIDQGECASVFLNGEIWERHLFDIDFLMCSPSGVKRPGSSFRFQNRSYSADSMLETRLDLNWAGVCYGYKLYQGASTWLGPRLGIHHVRFGATVNGETSEGVAMSNTRRLDATYPVVGIEVRHLFPYGLDVMAKLEGVHLITRGFLAIMRWGACWELHPDLVANMESWIRFVNSTENNQELNNEWRLGLVGFSTGLSFGF